MLSIDAWLDEKPYKELYDGAVHEKVSPQSDHSMVMLRFGRLLDDWAAGRGWVGAEWRVYPREGITLVPDVGFISDGRLAPLSREERQKPPLAPDIAVEIRSPDDRDAAINRKTSLYLELGTTLVVNVDPARRVVRLTDRERDIELDESATIEHHSFDGLQIPVAEIFATLKRA
ncbi:MAG: Uma2 family endonuclease [Vulcanimicrobiaceae bacterium]